MGIMSTPAGRALHFAKVHQGQRPLQQNRPPWNPSQKTASANDRKQGYLAQHQSKNSGRPQSASNPSQFEDQGFDKLQTVEPTLPIVPFKDQILRTIKENPYTILVAPTGTGKSTMLPLFLLEAGYEKIIVTNPRRVPTEQVAERVAFLDGSSAGERIGYRHGLKQNVSKDSQVIFTTEGYQLERELSKRETGRRVYILDEAHEFKADWEILLVLLREAIERGDDIKIVVATATLESQKLANYLGNDGRSVAVIDIPVKHYEIKEIDPGSNRSVAGNLEEGTLAFLWGKGRIERVADALQKMKPHIRPIPFHSDLPHHYQKDALKAFDDGNGALLATNCLQASVTVPKVTRVVTEGWVRRERVGVDGERHLAIEELSQHELTQQKGRTGRIGPGEFILVGGGRQPHLRPKEAPAEIQLKPLDSLVLRVHKGGRSFERLNNKAFHRAPPKNIERAVKSNQLLNLLGPSGFVAPSAGISLELPVEPNSKKTIAEAYRITTQLGLSATELIVPVIDLVSVIESEGIVYREFDDETGDFGDEIEFPYRGHWRRLCDPNLESDPLAQMQLFQRLLRSPNESFTPRGVNLHRVHNATLLREQLLQRLLIDSDAHAAFDLTPDQQQRQLHRIRECLWAGNINRLYRFIRSFSRWDRERREERPVYEYKPVFGDGELRELSSECGLYSAHAFIVGEAITIDKEPYDPNPLFLITMASAVSPTWLKKKADGSDLIKDAKEPIYEALRRARRLLRGSRGDKELQTYHNLAPQNRPGRHL